jgi:hypothetical protein
VQNGVIINNCWDVNEGAIFLEVVYLLILKSDDGPLSTTEELT